MNDWPPNPGLTVITSTRSRPGRTSSSITAGVAGLIATPAFSPSPLMRWIVRSRWIAPSTWTISEDDPASAKASRKASGSWIIRWVSSGSLVAGRSHFTSTGPNVMLGTNRPSITSTWIRSAPAASTSLTCSASRDRSAERMDGAILMRLSSFGLGIIGGAPQSVGFTGRTTAGGGTGRPGRNPRGGVGRRRASACGPPRRWPCGRPPRGPGRSPGPPHTRRRRRGPRPA